MNGDRYIVYKKGRRWHWKLWVWYHGSMAYCKDDGYHSEEAARYSIRSVHRATLGASQEGKMPEGLDLHKIQPKIERVREDDKP